MAVVVGSSNSGGVGDGSKCVSGDSDGDGVNSCGSGGNGDGGDGSIMGLRYFSNNAGGQIQPTAIVVVVAQFFMQFCLRKNEYGCIYLILLEIVLTSNLHLEMLLSSLRFSPTFLLCSATAFTQVFLGLPIFLDTFTLKGTFYSVLYSNCRTTSQPDNPAIVNFNST